MLRRLKGTVAILKDFLVDAVIGGLLFGVGLLFYVYS